MNWNPLWPMLAGGGLVGTSLFALAVTPRENYVYKTLQGSVAQAVMLERLGMPTWEWGDRALLRAFEWLHEYADYPAEDDDTWLQHLVNRAYGSRFPAPIPSSPGKAIGFADWTNPAPVP
jgi:hypothetical protein